MRAKHGNRLAGLDEERFVVLEAAQRRDDRVECLPRSRGAARAAVHDQVVWTFGDCRVQIVHEHPQGGFLRPPFAGDDGAARRADVAAESTHSMDRMTSQPSYVEG
jgi:hypothetical protein